MDNISHQEKAYLAAGCFWGIEELFRCQTGVIGTTVGYMGGHLENPTYQEVCSGSTGHAETIEVVFNKEQISYAKLLQIFWKNHDPTTLNRQGPDVGTQYRSAIFYTNTEQKQIAEGELSKLRQSGKYDKEIVTELMPAAKFWPAESYHQQYLQKQGLKSCIV